MIKLIPTNDCKVVVEPRGLGNFGCFSISGLERSAKEEYELCENIKDQIKRHIDDVQYVDIDTKYEYVDDDGNTYDTLYDVLEALYDEDGICPYYSFRYEKPSDKGVGCAGTRYSFEKLIEEAYENPWNFKVTDTNCPLSEEQEKFLNKVIEAGLQSK